MKNYNRPTVEVVNLKSSENIATSFKDIRKGFQNGFLGHNSINYAVSTYAITQSIVDDATSNS